MPIPSLLREFSSWEGPVCAVLVKAPCPSMVKWVISVPWDNQVPATSSSSFVSKAQNSHLFNLLSEGLYCMFSIWRNIVIAASESLNGLSFNRFLSELLFLPSSEYSPFPRRKNIFTFHFCDTCACAHVCLHLNKYVYMFDVWVGGSVHEWGSHDA